MGLLELELFAIVGFVLAAYSIVANDAIQTLGTFLSSNSHRHWSILWLYACTIIIVVMTYAYFINGNDIAYGRLNRIPYPEAGIQWWHALPPLILLFLTRFGIPVSTTFLILTIFTLTGDSSTDGVMSSMLIKSITGYFVAIAAGLVVYALVAGSFEKWVHNTPRKLHSFKWMILQWMSTAFLWSQWLVQDLANIFVFLPRQTSTLADGTTAVSFSTSLVVSATILMIILHAIIFATRGGKIQQIVLRKTNSSDVRSATLVDFIYGIILIFFKEINDIPMSTTWVFLGLLAGREVAIAYMAKIKTPLAALKNAGNDILKVLVGLLVSLILAISIPVIASGKLPDFF